MQAAAADDTDVADLAARAQEFQGAWSEAFAAAGDSLYEDGCGWPAGTGLP